MGHPTGALRDTWLAKVCQQMLTWDIVPNSMVDKHTLFETARHTHYKTYGWRKSVSNLNMDIPNSTMAGDSLSSTVTRNIPNSMRDKRTRVQTVRRATRHMAGQSVSNLNMEHRPKLDSGYTFEMSGALTTRHSYGWRKSVSNF